jgi:hypothetical protein
MRNFVSRMFIDFAIAQQTSNFRLTHYTQQPCNNSAQHYRLYSTADRQWRHQTRQTNTQHVPLTSGTTDYTVEPGYNDIGLYDTPSIASGILWYQLIPHC